MRGELRSWRLPTRRRSMITMRRQIIGERLGRGFLLARSARVWVRGRRRERTFGAHYDQWPGAPGARGRAAGAWGFSARDRRLYGRASGVRAWGLRRLHGDGR